MRRLIYPAIGLVTLIFSGGTFLLWFYFVPVTVSLCELARHPDWYNKRIVRVAAPATGISDSIIIGDPGCGLSDSMAIIPLAKGYVPKSDVQAFLQPSATNEPQFRRANIVVTGRFDRHATMGCFTPEFGIKVTNIELKSDVSIKPFPREALRRQLEANPTSP